MSLTKNAFQCFGCKAKGNILDFVRLKENVELREAALLISEWFGIGQDAIPHPAAKESVEEPTKDAELAKEKESANSTLKFSLKLDPDHPYLAERGLARETIEHFGLGFCNRGLMKERVAIPIHNEEGDLVAYAGRWPGEEPPAEEGKYKLPPGFKKHLVLFNLHRAIHESPEKKIIVVEGFFDCFSLWQAGYRNVAALMGSVLSKEQEELLVTRVKTVILMLDQDEAGNKATEDILPRLARKAFVRTVELPTQGAQPDMLTKEELDTLLRDV